MQGEQQQLWVDFMDGVTLLQRIDLSVYNHPHWQAKEKEKESNIEARAGRGAERGAGALASKGEDGKSHRDRERDIGREERDIERETRENRQLEQFGPAPTAQDQLSLFVNLYYVLLLHSFLVVGLPDRQATFSAISDKHHYEAFGDW